MKNSATSPHLNASPLRQRLQDLRIAVVGDAMLDHYVWGDVSRISPEAPVPVVNVRDETYVAGGALNVAMNLRGLGVNTQLVSCWGTDNAGRKLTELMVKEGVGIDGVTLTDSVCTTIKQRIVARTQQVCRLDREADSRHYSTAALRAASFIEAKSKDLDAIIVSDYGKGIVTQQILDTLETLAQIDGLKVAVDPKPRNRVRAIRPWVFTPNKSEAVELAGLSHHHDRDLTFDAICEGLHASISPEILLLTLGSEGMVVSTGSQHHVHLPTVAKEVFDVSGAGDTVIATFVAGLVAGLSPIHAAKLSNEAAGIVVSRLGTSPLTTTDLDKIIGLTFDNE